MTGRKLFGGALLMSLVAFSFGAETAYAQGSKPGLHQLELSNWKIDPTLSADVFGSAKATAGNTWFSPSYGANGVYYRVVPTP